MQNRLKLALTACATLLLPVACGPASDAPSAPEPSTVESSTVETSTAEAGKMTAGLQALKDLETKYDAAVVARDFGKVVELSMPPSLLKELATQGGAPSDMGQDELVAAVKDEISAAFDQIDSFAYTMPVDNAKIETSPTGREYALLPTDVDMEINGMKLRATGHTLALVENGTWYLVNPSDEMTIGIIKSTFPDLSAVQLEANAIEIVQ